MKALYGFSADLPPFRGKTANEQVALLAEWGADSIFGGYKDPRFVDAIHQSDLKIYAEFACFQGERWWKKVPSSRPILVDGTVLQPVEWYCGVNPSEPAVREALLEELATLVQQHEIQGVWLDFIRWPCRWERPDPLLFESSFDEATLSRFHETHNQGEPIAASIATGNHTAIATMTAWHQWRMEQITSWVAAARTLVDTIRPGISLGLFGLPWRQQDFNGAIQTIVGQDFSALASYIDSFSPMTYHAMCGQPVTWIEEVVHEIKAITEKPVIPIVQSVDHPSTLSATEYGQALQAAHNAGNGAIVFTLKGLLDQEKLAVTQKLWRQ